MKIITGRSAILKSVIVLAGVGLFAAFVIFGGGNEVAASAFGPSASHTNAPGEDNCTSCHNSFPVNSGKGSVQISGVPATYTQGQPIAITVTTTEATAVNYGFQLTAIDAAGHGVGTFTLPEEQDPTMLLLNGLVNGNIRVYVEHTENGLFTNGVFGSNSWTFTWTAPAVSTGTVTFYAAGNGANGVNGPSGDYIYTTTASTSPASSASITGKVLTPDGRGVRNAQVTLTGQGVATSTLTNSFGIYNFSSVPTGQTYIMRAFSKSYRFPQKFVNLTGNLTGQDFIGFE